MSNEKSIILDTSPFIYYIIGEFCKNKTNDFRDTFRKINLTKQLGFNGYIFIDRLHKQGFKFLIPTYVLVEAVNHIKNEKNFSGNKYYSEVLELIPEMFLNNQFKELIVSNSVEFMTIDYKYYGLTDNFLILNSNNLKYPVMTSDIELYNKLYGNSILFA